MCPYTNPGQLKSAEQDFRSNSNNLSASQDIRTMEDKSKCP